MVELGLNLISIKNYMVLSILMNYRVLNAFDIFSDADNVLIDDATACAKYSPSAQELMTRMNTTPNDTDCACAIINEDRRLHPENITN